MRARGNSTLPSSATYSASRASIASRRSSRRAGVSAATASYIPGERSSATSHQSSRLGYRKVKSTWSISARTKPASSSASEIVAGSRQANWPGASGAGGSAAPIRTSSWLGTEDHALSSGPVHAASATVPPGLSTRRVSRSAAPGSASSMYPQRQRTPSTSAVGRSIHSASMTLNSTLVICSSAARARATSIMPSETSLRIIVPMGCSSSAARSPVSPGPAASSSMRRPGCGSTRSTSHCETGSAAAWKTARCAPQPRAERSQRSVICARSASGSLMPGAYAGACPRASAEVRSQTPRPWAP